MLAYLDNLALHSSLLQLLMTGKRNKNAYFPYLTYKGLHENSRQS
jgi:hypothetical protein